MIRQNLLPRKVSTYANHKFVNMHVTKLKMSYSTGAAHPFEKWYGGILKMSYAWNP